MDVLQPDIAVCGGLTGVSRVVALAEVHNCLVIPHVWGSTVNFHAALHLVARRSGAAAPFPWLEYDVGLNLLLELAGWPLVSANRTIAMPNGRGLGIELTAECVSRLAISQRTLR